MRDIVRDLWGLVIISHDIGHNANRYSTSNVGRANSSLICWGGPHGAVINVLDCDIVKREFEFLS